MTIKYKRLLLKLSGEIFSPDYGYDFVELQKGIAKIKEVYEMGVEVAIVVGAGNILRGRQFDNNLVGRVTCDQMGMMATVMNGLALRDSLTAINCKADLFASTNLEGIAPKFTVNDAINSLENGKILVLSGGTGNPFFTTDTAAALRAAELEVDLLVKMTKVDGIYDKDPHLHKDAKLLTELSYQNCIDKNIEALDACAFILCQENNIKLRVINMYDDSLCDLVKGKKIGSAVQNFADK